MTTSDTRGRLNFWHAAFIIARRDFTAILCSRSFIFFLLGPLFPVIVAGLAGGVGAQMQSQASRSDIGIAMSGEDVERMLSAREELARQIGGAMPSVVALERLTPGQEYDPSAVLESGEGSLAAIVTGTPQAPVMTGTEGALANWQGSIAMIAARANSVTPMQYPAITLRAVATSGASERGDRLRTAQSAQVLLFLLIMLLASMVLSNLVEEKGNKIIEILAAAIPMNAVFCGKLFAMLGISIVGICVWGSAAGLILSFGPSPFADLADPGVGWPVFLFLGAVYFAMGYLLLGSVFLAIGSLAATVREVQTLSMPVTMGQVLVFFMASLAVTQSGSWLEYAAIAFPLSSPFAMLARAAVDSAIWPHLLAICWQALCVAVFIRLGSNLFRSKVMKSGPAGKKAGKSSRGLKGAMSSAFRNGSGAKA